MFDVVERFLRYVKIDTQSSDESETYPSTAKQLDLLRLLVDELNAIGLDDVAMDQWGYVTATLPANIDHDVPVVAFLAHVDTSSAASGTNVKPRIVENYSGEDILLNPDENILLSPTDFPELKQYMGQALIVTDGTTLLGADDKAGVAEIVSALAYLNTHPEIKHGKVRVAFTPDEEVGGGVDHFDVAAFGANFAYTLDGGQVGELEYETFNAAGATLTFRGRSVHPGTAKGQMKNAALIAMEYNALLPVFDRPEFTEKYEGFFHLVNMQGQCETAKLGYIIRDHDEAGFALRKQVMQDAVDFINKRYGADTVVLSLRDQYFNMKIMIEPYPQIMEIARQAFQAVGLAPRVEPVRGGTDGSRLSYMGLPTPNIFTGGHNYHGRFEYIPIPSMHKAVEVILKIAEIVGREPTL